MINYDIEFKIFIDLNIYIINSKINESTNNNLNILQTKLKKFNINIVEPEKNENDEIDYVKTHINCIIESKKNQMTLIINDNIILNDNFEYLFINVYEFLCINDDWKIYLGGCSRINENNILNNFSHNNLDFFKIKNVNCFHFIIYNQSSYDIILNTPIQNLKTIESFWKNNDLCIVTSIPFLSNQINLKTNIPNELIIQNEKFLYKYIHLKKNIIVYIINSGHNNENFNNNLNIFSFCNVQIVNHDNNLNILDTHIKCIQNSKYFNFEKIYIVNDNCFFQNNFKNNFEKVNQFLNEYRYWNIYFGIYDNFDKIENFDKLTYEDILFFKINNIPNLDFVCYNKNIFDFFINCNPQINLTKFYSKLNLLISIPFIANNESSILNKHEKNIIKNIIPNYEIYDVKFFVINLRVANDRMEQIYKTFKKFNVIRVEACMHKTGWKGCLLSHLKCLQYAKLNNLKYIWVLEDDCSPCPDFINRFNIVNEYLSNNDNWNLYMGGCTKITKNNIIDILSFKNEKFIEINYSNCMHMVCYNHKIYDFFLKIYFDYIEIIDYDNNINNNQIDNNKIDNNKKLKNNDYKRNLYKKKEIYKKNIDKYLDKPIDEIWHNFTTAIVSVPFLAYQNSTFSYINNKPAKYYRSLKSTEKICCDFIDEES